MIEDAIGRLERRAAAMLRRWHRALVAAYGHSGETGALLAAMQPEGYVVPLLTPHFERYLPRFAEPLYRDLLGLIEEEAARAFNPRWKTLARSYMRSMQTPGTDAYRVMQAYGWRTRRTVESALREGLREGLTGRETAALMQERLAAVVPARARAIGITESMRARNMGEFHAASEASRESGRALRKGWDWSGVSRQDHAAIHGVQIALEEDFNVGGERAAFPHDPRLSAAQSVFCGCGLTYSLAA